MPALRTALLDAVLARLAEAMPDMLAQRGRRAEVAEEERPLLAVSTADAGADDTFAFGLCLWTLELTVAGHVAATANAAGSATAASADAAAEDACAAMEARILEALTDQALPRPGGGDLTLGLQPLSSGIEIYPAERAARRLGDVTVTFRAQIVLPAGVATL